MRMISCWLASLYALGLLAAGPATAQEEESPLFEQGRTLYEDNCVQCHRPSGEGVPPTFPALAGNEDLKDLPLVVDRIHNGREAMPAFPQFDAAELAAVASYIRDAWGNSLGPVTEEDVNAILEGENAGSAAADEGQAPGRAADTGSDDGADVTEPGGTAAADAIGQRTIWDGVYTEEQAEGARRLYLGACASCHGRRLNGAPDDPDAAPAPPLAGPIFLREWGGRSLAVLYEYTRTQMPVRNPGQFSDQQYVDLIAYMLHYDEAPAGDEPLPPDNEALGLIEITEAPPN